MLNDVNMFASRGHGPGTAQIVVRGCRLQELQEMLRSALQRVEAASLANFLRWSKDGTDDPNARAKYVKHRRITELLIGDFIWESFNLLSLMSRVSWGKALESRIQDQERQAVWDSISWDLNCSTGYQWSQLSTCWPLEHNQKQMGYHSAVVIRCRLHVAAHSMTQTQTLVFQQANKQNEPCTSQSYRVFARVAKWGRWPQPNETVSWCQSYLMNTPRFLHCSPFFWAV